MTVPHGLDVKTVTVTAGEGYTFTGWTGDYAGTDNSLAPTSVTSDMRVTANFTLSGGEGEGEGEGDPCASDFHAADSDQNNKIELTELLRVIQFYNSGGFHRDATTPDGYAPGLTGDQTCCPHESDFSEGQDWQIKLTELLRLIQFYNSGGYHACPEGGTDDGFCPGI